MDRRSRVNRICADESRGQHFSLTRLRWRHLPPARFAFHFALNHPFFACGMIPTIGKNAHTMREQPDPPTKERPLKPEMIGSADQVQRGEQEVHRDIDGGMPIEPQSCFNARHRPPVGNVVHDAYLSISASRWRARNAFRDCGLGSEFRLVAPRDQLAYVIPGKVDGWTFRW